MGFALSCLTRGLGHIEPDVASSLSSLPLLPVPTYSWGEGCLALLGPLPFFEAVSDCGWRILTGPPGGEGRAPPGPQGVQEGLSPKIQPMSLWIQLPSAGKTFLVPQAHGKRHFCQGGYVGVSPLALTYRNRDPWPASEERVCMSFCF